MATDRFEKSTEVADFDLLEAFISEYDKDEAKEVLICSETHNHFVDNLGNTHNFEGACIDTGASKSVAGRHQVLYTTSVWAYLLFLRKRSLNSSDFEIIELRVWESSLQNPPERR